MKCSNENRMQHHWLWLGAFIALVLPLCMFGMSSMRYGWTSDYSMMLKGIYLPMMLTFLTWFVIGMALSPILWMISKARQGASWQWFNWLNAGAYISLCLIIMLQVSGELGFFDEQRGQLLEQLLDAVFMPMTFLLDTIGR